MKVKALFLALTLCFATANAKKVHKKKHRHRSKEYPVFIIILGPRATKARWIKAFHNCLARGH